MNADRKKPRVRPVPAVTRAIAVLRLLSRTPAPLSLKTIANELAIVPSTCLHILRALVDEGLVEAEAGSKRYRLGPGLLVLAYGLLAHHSFGALAQPALNRLSANWNVTAIGVQVSELDRMIVVALARSPSPFSLHVDVGSQFPALISATGRLVAAYSTLPWPVIARQFKQLRWQRAIALSAWKKEVDTARRRGYSLDKGNYIDGVTLVAVPLVDVAGRLTHTLVCAGFNQQLKGTKMTALVQEMQHEAAAIGAQLVH